MLCKRVSTCSVYSHGGNILKDSESTTGSWGIYHGLAVMPWSLCIRLDDWTIVLSMAGAFYCVCYSCLTGIFTCRIIYNARPE